MCGWCSKGGCYSRARSKRTDLVRDEDVEAFRRDGAVPLRGCFEPHWLESVARGFEINLADPGPDGMRYTADGRPGSFRDDYCNWQRIEEYRDFIWWA